MGDKVFENKSEDTKDTMKHKRKRIKIQDIPNKNHLYGVDSSYKYIEQPLEKPDECFEYAPEFFMRTHSKNNDPADVQTQIWQCAFEPDVDNPGQHTNIVATCGGTSVCFVEVDTGGVRLKYGQKNSKQASPENLYALAWSTIPLDEFGLKRMNVLATGGGKSTVALIDPEAGCCYKNFRTVPHRASAIVNSLLFHPKKASWLFCAHDDGHIQLWDIGVPPLPSYEVCPRQLINIPKVGGEIYNLAFSQTNDLLIAGCEFGLYMWEVDMEKVEKCHRLDRTMISLPDPEDSDTVVDSICLIRDNILAAKCALHGCIYVFNISNTIKNSKLNKTKHQNEVTLKPNKCLKLKWSDTDNYYMNMGCDQSSGILVCGDDMGTLWVYDLYQYLSGKIENPLTHPEKVYDKFVKAKVKLCWPDLEDPEVEKARKLRLDSHEIVVDKCTVSRGGENIVAVTNNNMVCVWKRSPEDDSDEYED